MKKLHEQYTVQIMTCYMYPTLVNAIVNRF